MKRPYQKQPLNSLAPIKNQLQTGSSVASILSISPCPPPYDNEEGLQLVSVCRDGIRGKLQRIPLPFGRRRTSRILGTALLDFGAAVASILRVSPYSTAYGHAEGLQLIPDGMDLNGSKVQRIPMPLDRRRHESWERRCSISAPRLPLSSGSLRVPLPMVM
jgi:hypothetical protein